MIRKFRQVPRPRGVCSVPVRACVAGILPAPCRRHPAFGSRAGRARQTTPYGVTTNGVLGAFTLLELLVAMTLMVITAACLYTALYTGFRAKRSASSAVEPTALAINAIELIKQDACGILPVGGTLAGTFLGTDAQGLNGVDADSLEFYTTHIYAADDDLVGGLGKIELVLEQDSDEDSGSGGRTCRLIRKVTTNLLSPRTIEPQEQVLCRNVRSLNLRYYDGEDWLDEWDSTADANSLPLAIQIDIQVLHNGTNRTAFSVPRSAERSTQHEARSTRRLIQSFPIPCGGDQQGQNESNTAGTTASGGQTGT